MLGKQFVCMKDDETNSRNTISAGNLSLKQQLKYNNLVYRAKLIAKTSVEEYYNALHFDCKPPKTLQLMRFQCAKKNRSSYS